MALLIGSCVVYGIVALIRALDWLTTRYIGGIGSNHHKKYGEYRGNALTFLEFLGTTIGWLPWVLTKVTHGLIKGK